MSERTLRASEIAHFLYCRRAWGYARQGYPRSETGRLEAGEAFHGRHGRGVLVAGCLRTLGYVLVLAGVVVLAVHLTSLVLG